MGISGWKRSGRLDRFAQFNLFILWFQPWPHLIDGGAPGLFLFSFSGCIPCPEPEVTEHVHGIDVLHPPSVLQQCVVGRIHILRQRQGFVGVFFVSVVPVSVAAGFIGNSDSTCVVAVCTAMSAIGISTISRSEG